MAKAKNKIYIFIAVIGLLVFFHFIGLLSPVEKLTNNIFKPFLGGFYSFSSSIRNFFADQMEKKDLVRNNQQLRDEVTQLTTDNIKLKALEEENQTLRQYLKFLGKNEYRYMLGNVISRNSLTGADQTIVVDKGSDDGVKPEMAVVGSYGAVIGKIKEVKNGISTVTLINNPQTKIAATIQNINKTSGIVQGELGLTVRMSYIPQSENVKVGDTVVTSGLEANIPRGFAIGKVTEVKKENNELWQSAIIEPLVDLNKLVIVSVVFPEAKK